MSRSTLIVFACTLVPALAALPATAQRTPASDSLAMERRISVAAADVPFAEGARALLMARLTSGEPEEARRIIDFMERRTGYSPAPWLAPRERLLAEALTAPLRLIRNRPALEQMLRRDRDAIAGASAFEDHLADRMRELLRITIAENLRTVGATGSSDSELRFAELFLNWLMTRGYRPRNDLDIRIEAFTAAYPDDPLVAIATEYLMSRFQQSTLGGAFSAGYTVGAIGGGLGERFDLFRAPSLAGELYYGGLTMTADLEIGAVEAPSDFAAGGMNWKSGTTSLLIGELTVGYEIRSGRLAVTPSAGVAVESATGALESEGADPPRTEMRYGWSGALGLGYRIPSDVGPHFDLRARIGYIASALDGYDRSLDGGITYLRLGFALVQRPWTE